MAMHITDPQNPKLWARMSVEYREAGLWEIRRGKASTGFLMLKMARLQKDYAKVLSLPKWHPSRIFCIFHPFAALKLKLEEYIEIERAIFAYDDRKWNKWKNER